MNHYISLPLSMVHLNLGQYNAHGLPDFIGMWQCILILAMVFTMQSHIKGLHRYEFENIQ